MFRECRSRCNKERELAPGEKYGSNLAFVTPMAVVPLGARINDKMDEAQATSEKISDELPDGTTN